MGFADAHNFGIVAAAPRTDLVVLLNQDTKSGAGWIDRCAEAFADDPKLGVVMPGLRTYDDDGWDENFLTCARANQELMEQLDRGGADLAACSEGVRCFPVPVVTGAAMVVRTEVLWKVGLFDPVFGSYYEDYDFCRRASRAGWGIGICPRARVFHYQGSATTSKAARRRRERWIARNRVIERVRESGDRRGRVLLRHMLRELPRNLLRGILRTPSSQSVRATLAAEGELLRLWPRLISAERDKAEWEKHLAAIGWPRQNPHGCGES
jgi:GT2 family glycosyltransferase